MQLEEYFDFLAPDDIRVKGTRVGIESILYEHLHRDQPPEAIAAQFPSVTLEQVYATVLYYLRHKESVSAYLAKWLDYCLAAEQAYEQDPPPVAVRLRQLRADRESVEVAS